MLWVMNRLGQHRKECQLFRDYEPSLKVSLTFPMPRFNFCTNHKDAKIFKNHLNSVMLVFIGML